MVSGRGERELPTYTNLPWGKVGVVSVSMKDTSSELNRVSKGTYSVRRRDLMTKDPGSCVNEVVRDGGGMR